MIGESLAHRHGRERVERAGGVGDVTFGRNAAVAAGRKGQKRVLIDLFADGSLEFQIGHLQQLDGLHQLRSHGQCLSLGLNEPER